MLLMLSGLAHAGPFAWVFADQETEPNEYTPDLDYQFNTLSYDDITVDRSSTGVYKVYIPYDTSRGAYGNVQVGAVGYDSHYCKVSGWGEEPARNPDAMGVTVRCFNSAGTAADSKFNLLFNSSDSSEWTEYDEPASRLAYLWANQHTNTANYVPSASYQFNSEGSSNNITRTSTGRYTVSLPDMTPWGNLQVTAYGTNSVRCGLAYWTGWTSTTAYVSCYNAAGTLTDSQFTLSHHYRMALANNPTTAGLGPPPGYEVIIYPSGRNGAYTWTGGTSSGALNSLYSWAAETGDPFPTNSSVGALTRVSTGVYEVLLEDVEAFDFFPSTVLVTAYAGSTPNANHCKVSNWEEIGTDTEVVVRCFNTAGAAVDSQFTLTYQDSASIVIVGP